MRFRLSRGRWLTLLQLSNRGTACRVVSHLITAKESATTQTICRSSTGLGMTLGARTKRPWASARSLELAATISDTRYLYGAAGRVDVVFFRRAA